MFHFSSRFWLLLVCCALPSLTAAQSASRVALDSSETVFAVVTAINACGYDQDMAASEPLRAQIRSEVVRSVQESQQARSSLEQLCGFYRDHRATDDSQELAQYVSLALNLGAPPAFTPAVKEADLPPDAGYVLGLVPLIQNFYQYAALDRIWERHHGDYEALVDKYNRQVSNMLLATDGYLRMPVSSSSGSHFTLYLEPMAAPGQINARNYGGDYFMVVAPGRDGLRMDAIRHTYLHSVLDRLGANHGTAMGRLEPLLDAVRTAPMDQSFKEDITLLVTECLIRAVEARTAITGKSKSAEADRKKLAQRAAQEGFLLTPYFERQLATFEKSQEGLQLVFSNWLNDVDIDGEAKHAREIRFVAAASSNDIHGGLTPRPALLAQAEKQLEAGDLRGARELAQQALDQKREDQGQALFLLARISVASRDVDGARSYFQRTLVAAHDPRLIAWSHIYLGRICDLNEERDEALEHYNAALKAGDQDPATLAAAQRGLAVAYEPPDARDRKKAEDQDPQEPEDRQ